MALHNQPYQQPTMPPSASAPVPRRDFPTGTPLPKIGPGPAFKGLSQRPLSRR